MQRARANVFPRIPESLQDLTGMLQDPAWASLVNTLDGEDSIYLGSTSGVDGSHNIVFMSRRCIEIMKIVDILFADGTFYIKPSVTGCYQVLTIPLIFIHSLKSLLVLKLNSPK